MENKTSGEGRESTVAASVVIPKDSSESAAKDLVSRWLIESSAFHVGLSNGNTEPDYNDLIVRIESALTAARDSERERAAKILDEKIAICDGHIQLNDEQGRDHNYGCWRDIRNALNHSAAAIRGTTQPDDDLKIQNVESQVSVSALPECKAEGCNEPSKNCEYCERHHMSLCGQLHHRLGLADEALSLLNGE